MQKVLVAGAGKIGSLIAVLLATSGDYKVTLIDSRTESLNSVRDQLYQTAVMDVSDHQRLDSFIKKEQFQALVSCLPFTANIGLATLAKANQLHYFDLTEDTQVSAAIGKLATDAKTAFVPQCGIAPGFISIIAGSLMKSVPSLESVALRVGALPKYSHHALKYALTWSPEGLINEYANECDALVNARLSKVQPLEDLETLEIDGLQYEAFNTSGGLGTLAATYEGKVNSLNYKTIRYPGHCEKMRFLMQDLMLSQSRDVLKNILINALPQSSDDVVIIYVVVKGKQNQALLEKNYMKKFYPKVIAGNTWSAIQVTTASSACVVIDMVLQQPALYKGFIKQESLELNDFLQNRFAGVYREN